MINFITAVELMAAAVAAAVVVVVRATAAVVVVMVVVVTGEEGWKNYNLRIKQQRLFPSSDLVFNQGGKIKLSLRTTLRYGGRAEV